MKVQLPSHRTIDLPWTGSLYEASSDLTISKLEAVADLVKPSDIVILRITGDSHDYSLSWLNSLRSDALWCELERRFTRIHQILLRITLSKGKWFFLTGGDCVGSWWELALSCQGIIFTNPFAKVGFPEVYIDMFPPLGILGLKRFPTYENTATLKQRAILHAREAFKLGIVDLCMQSDHWINDTAISNLLPWMVRFKSRHELRSSTRLEYLREIPSSAQLANDRARPEYRREELESTRIDSAFSALREKNVVVRARTLATIRSGGVARFLHPDYRAWLSRRVSRYRFGLHDRWWSAASDVIVMNVDEGTPPQSVVISVLLRRKKITFVARESLQLKTALETIRARFDKRAESDRDALDLWQRSVFWVCGADSSMSSVCCKFRGDDIVEISRGSVSETYFRMSGNFGQAGTGWYELVRRTESSGGSAAARDEIDETVRLMANGILASEWRGSMPLAVALRHLLLEQMCQMTTNSDQVLGMSGLLKLLGESGWGFASDTYQWDLLLKHYPPVKDVLEIFRDLWPGTLTREWLAIEIRAIAGIVPRKADSRIENGSKPAIRAGAAFTRQLGVFAQIVSRSLVDKGIVATSDEADLFVTLSWGFPSLLPLPSLLRSEMGKVRLASLAEGAGLVARP